MKKTYFLMVVLACFTLNAISLPKLSSFPSATATIFLDFDGQTVNSTIWNGGNTLYCAPSGMTDVQITEVFNRVAEDYRPFNMNITTDSTVFLAAPLTSRIRIIITPTSSWKTGVGGVSYTGSFTWGDDTPGFVFSDRLGPNSPKMIAECCTHESGHTVGLSHQSKYDNNCSLIDIYNTGTGQGQTSWAPVMGNSYYSNLSGWNDGPTPSGCSSTQDNLSIITTQNGFTYRPDDHADDLNTPSKPPTAIAISNQAFSTSGIITTTADLDAFAITLPQNSVVHLDALPFSIGPNNAGADLDIKLSLYNSNKQLIMDYNPASILNVTIDTTLNAGTYYLVIDGTSNSNVDDYGSLGSYTISGTVAPIAVVPIRNVALSAKADNNKHSLSWSIISDETIKSIDLEVSSDGRNFKKLSTVSATTTQFSYTPLDKTDLFYRIKVTSVIEQSLYSNVVVIKANGSVKMFTISTFVHDEIKINGAENYQYQLLDMSGRVIAKGNNSAGATRININSEPNGMYVLQLNSNSGKTTERIIKQ